MQKKKQRKTTTVSNELSIIGNKLSRLPNCGGNWTNGSGAGVFYVNLNNTRSNSNTNRGFRSALPSLVRRMLHNVQHSSTEGIKELVSTPKN